MKSLLFLLIFIVEGCIGYKVVCVYTNWSQYRPDGAKFLPEDVDASLCTHLIYVYAKLKGNKLEPTEWNDDGSAWSEGMYERVNNLKQINPEMKMLLGVGGWMMGSKDFSKLASGRISRKLFAKTSVKFLRDRKFDGLSIDWQHPTKRGGKPQDKVNFSLLLKEIRKAFQEDSRKTGLPPLLLTAGVSASREVIEDGYEIDNITKYADFLNVMAYDLHGAWENYTGHPSQLYPREEEFGPSTEINVDSAMRFWMSKVPDKSKLILGVSTYGRTFTLRKSRHNDYNVPTTGPGDAGEFTQQPGMLAYYERCSQYADARRVWDATSQVAYWYKGNQWIAGEDVESVKAKVNWARTYEIGGLMLWSLDTDDFDDMCLSELYPLLNAIVTALNDPTFVKRNITLGNQIELTPSKSSNNETLTGISDNKGIADNNTVKGVSQNKAVRDEPRTTTNIPVEKTTQSTHTTTKESKKLNTKIAPKTNLKVMTTQTRVNVDIQGKAKEQPLNKTNTLQNKKSLVVSQSTPTVVKSTKSKKGKQKGKRRRMTPKMRRILMLRRKKQQNMKSQLRIKGKATKSSESKPTGARQKLSSTSQNGKDDVIATHEVKTKSKSEISDVKIMTEENGKNILNLKQEAKKTTKIKLAMNESNVDERILTKDMLLKSANQTKESKKPKAKSGSKTGQVTVGKTLRISAKASDIPIINVKKTNLRKKRKRKSKPVKPHKGKSSHDQKSKEMLEKRKQIDNIKEATIINIQRNKDSVLNKTSAKTNVKQKNNKSKPGTKKTKWRRRKVSKQKKRVKVRRRKNEHKAKTVNN